MVEHHTVVSAVEMRKLVTRIDLGQLVDATVDFGGSHGVLGEGEAGSVALPLHYYYF